MVAEVARTRAAAEQTVNGAHFGGDVRTHFIGHLQPLDLLPDGLGQACRGLAGGRRQANAQGAALLHRRRLQQAEQAHHRGGLAGAGATGDDTEPGAGGQGAGQFLPVHLGTRRTAFEQLRQAQREIVLQGLQAGQALMQGGVDAPFVGPVAPQVQALRTEHQWPGALLDGVAIGHQSAFADALQPSAQVQAGQQLRRQQQWPGQGIPFRWQRQSEVRLGQGLRQVQANMAMAQLMAGQGRRQQHQRVAARSTLFEEAHERAVEGAQPAALHPAVEQGQQVLAVAQGGQRAQVLGLQRGGQQVIEASAHGAAPVNRSCCSGAWTPRNKASSASISARGGRA